MISLDDAQVFDVEVLPNAFTLSTETLNAEIMSTWEISEFRDDRQALMQWFNWLQQTQTPMIGFNNEFYDYVICHFIYKNPGCTPADIYAKNQELFAAGDNRFAHTIWPRDRFAPQIDLYKINHFDNRAKTTSLKALQVNMRSPTVVDSPIPFGVPVSAPDVDTYLIPYNKHDVSETKRFALICMSAIEFRIGLIPQFGVECLSWNDTKIGEKMLEQRLGDDVCYDRSSGRKQKRQTIRSAIALKDIIFPYVQFQHPEFQRVLDFMRAQVLTPDDLDDPEATIKTKGVFTGLHADVGGLTFHFGTGGVHASVTAQRFTATEDWLIRDIDVASLYPNIAIQNRLAPAHLGEAFTSEYAKLPAERKEWQKLKGKKCVEANSIKLAANGAYGKTNSKFSFLYDPQYTMQVTINGQLLLCMLAEWISTVPTLQMIQANTDGISYLIHRDHLNTVKQIEQQWQDFTKLELEDQLYAKFIIADVNTYIAIGTDGSTKLKGRLWHPDPLNYAQSISETQPPAWHKDLGNIVSVRAANAAMIHGIDPETFIRCHSDPYDFMLRAKVDRSSMLLLGDMPIQRTSRYYVARNGANMVKVSPPVAGGVIGQWKRANGITKSEYDRVMQETGGAHDERVCTKNKSKYEERRMAIEAGWKVAECNDARDFRFDNLDYAYYVNEAKKLIIA